MGGKRIIAVLTACAMLATLAGCGKKDTQETDADLSSAPTQEQQAKAYFGTLKALSETKVIPNGKGQVKKCPYEVGDYVAGGTLLYTIDDNGMTDTIATTKNSIQKACISIQTAQENLANLKVYAPASGILKNFSIKTGERVNASKIGEIADEGRLVAKVPFNAAQKDKIAVGDAARVESADFMSAVEGRVTRIYDAKADSIGGSILYNIEITIEKPGGFAAGQSVDAVVTNQNGTFSSPASGILEAAETVSVVSRGSGNALRVYAREGDYVKKGSLLVEMENSTVSSTLERAQLDKKDLEIKLARLEKNYADLFVYAPAGGEIIAKSKGELDNITSNSESIMTIADTKTLVLELDLDEESAQSVAAGETVNVILNADGGRIVSGIVEKISAEGIVTGNSRRYPILVYVTNDGTLKPGTAASIDFGGDVQ